MEKEKSVHYANLQERKSFTKLVSVNPNYFGTIPKSKFPVVLKLSEDTFYEEISDAGYHPDLQILTATIQVKQPVGYGGDLCSDGSVEYVRFYLDYGAGWEDQGYTGVSVHDIPSVKDCHGNFEKPVSYVAQLQINPKSDYCDTPVIPKVRAVLSWNSIPDPDPIHYHPVWGNIFEGNVQIKPLIKWVISPVISQSVAAILSKVIKNPHMSLSQIVQAVPSAKKDMKNFTQSLEPPSMSLHDMAAAYSKLKKAVPAHRYGLSAMSTLLSMTDHTAMQKQVEALKIAGFPWENAVAALAEANADISYEELKHVGLDFARNSLAATFRIKLPGGYSGNLCHAGSYEYISFWADWNNDCKWTYINTASVNVHDIPAIPASGIYYTVLLPYDFSKYATPCNEPKVVRIRAVLSWAVPPSTTDPDALTFWGNWMEAYVQIPPSTGTAENPVFNILGGIPVDKIDDITGLTTVNAKFALNMQPVEAGAPFAGVIVIQGPLFPGLRYRIKATNQSSLVSYYITNSFVVVGYLPVPPYVQYTNMIADPSTGYFTYLGNKENTDGILARWMPGTSDKWQLELEIEFNPVKFSKMIQLDSIGPSGVLTINDNNDCRHFKEGDEITGQFTAYDAYISSYTISSSVGEFKPIPPHLTSLSGTSNVFNLPFKIDSGKAPSPCGEVALVVYEKTIHDSQWIGNHVWAEKIICLQPK